MTVSKQLIVFCLKFLTSLICRIEDAALNQVPQHGPLIIYTNHVNILEIPIIYTHLQPRRVHGMLLAGRWKNPLLGWMLNATETIPIHRAEADITAIHKGLEVLQKGETIIIAPEGTRSHDGQLQAAHPGVVLFALHSQAPLLPVVYYGAENYKENMKHLRRTDFHINVGKSFHLNAQGEKVTRLVREEMLAEMMYQLAGLLPDQYRGQYADPPQSPQRYLVFD